jgi:single-stranded-DNA-specific exonuclease
MGEPHKAVELFLAGTEDEMEHLAAYIIDLNKKRKGLEDGVWNTALSRAKKSYEDTGNKFVLVSGKCINRGITGLLASRLVKFFKVPAIVVSLMKERATGSLRCPGDFKIGNFLSHFEDLFIDFGGHDYAAGFTMAVEKEPEFEARFYEFVPTFNPPEKEEDIRFVDAEIPLSYLKPDLWNVVEFFEPYGEGNPQLVFLTRGMRIESCDLFGRKSDEHLKMLLDSGGFKWPAILWNGAGRLDTDFSLYDKVDVLYNLSKNQYRNKETLQLIILDINK